MLIKEQLDRAVASKEWIDLYQQASVKHFNMESSDHCPILIQIESPYYPQKRPFRFLKVWTSDCTSVEVVRRAWNRDRRNRICKRLAQTTKDLRAWNKDVFGLAHYHKP